MRNVLKIYIRAFRLNFITASILPYLAGSFLAKSLSWFELMIGLTAVVGTHLGANLINDYSDSRSGVDWKDRKFYGFFGGSKLIQDGVLSERFYLGAALFWFLLAFAAVGTLALARSPDVLVLYAIVFFLGFFYSRKPFKFSYRRMGEAVIFILFGLAAVMGGYYIQTGDFPSIKSFLLSLPFGFFTAAILFVNEVPDCNDDISCGKFTLVSVVGSAKAYVVYDMLMFMGFLAILLNVFTGNLSVVSLVSLLLVSLVGPSSDNLRGNFADKEKLVMSSKFTIAVAALAGVVICLDLLI